MSDQTDAADLLPCPAGCSPDHLIIVGDRRRKVRCTSCGWIGPTEPSKAEAIAAWNYRDPAVIAALTEVQALVADALERAVAAVFAKTGFDDDHPVTCAIRAMIPADHAAALAARDKRIRAEERAKWEACLAVAMGGCDANNGLEHSPISLPNERGYIFCEKCGETLTKATAKAASSAAAQRSAAIRAAMGGEP